MDIKKVKNNVREFSRNNKLDDAIDYLEDLIKLDNANTELKILMSILLVDDYIYDIKKALSYLNFSPINQSDVRILILKVYIEYYFKGRISEKSKDDLLSILNSEQVSVGYNKFTPFLLALYYEKSGTEEQYYNYLHCSIRIDTTSVNNFEKLAQYYYQKKLYRNAEINIRKALFNVAKVEEAYLDVDTLSFDAIVNEHIAGIDISHINYDDLKQKFNTYNHHLEK